MDYNTFLRLLIFLHTNTGAYIVTVIIAAAFASAVLKHYLFKWLKGAVAKTGTRIDDIIVEESGKAVSVLVYLIALYLILSKVYPNYWLLQLLLAVSILLVGKAVVNIISGSFREYVHLLPLEEDQKDLLLGMEGSIKAVLYVIIVLVMLASVGIDVWPIITSLGIGGLAISMAMKDVLTDYISGIIVILGRSLKKGDRVLVKDKGVEGIVEEIGWRYTTLRTDEGEAVTIPNRVISSSVIVFKKG